MRLLRSVLLASSCVLSSVSASDSAAAPDDDGSGAATAISRQTLEVYTMGFEAETSVFKVRPREGDETYKMKIFSVPENPPHLWVFTSDTLDNTIQRSSPPHWMNTESLTIGGLNEKQIQEAAKNVKAFWDFLCKKLTDPTHEYNLTATDISFPVKWSDPSVEMLSKKTR